MRFALVSGKGQHGAGVEKIGPRLPDITWMEHFFLAFDPIRQAILLLGGDKAETDHERFYQPLIIQTFVSIDILKPFRE